MANDNYNRMSAKDFRNEYMKLKDEIKSLEIYIATRLQVLCKMHPEAPVKKTKYTNVEREVIIYARGFTTKQAISFLSVDEKLMFIENIEKYLESKNPNQQLTIKFE